VARVLEDARAWVVVLVHAVTEAREAERVVGVLRHAHVLVDVAAVGGDAVEHLDHGLVGTTVERTPQGVDAGGDRCEEVGLTRADQPHRAGGAVLLVVGMEDQQLLQGDHGVVAHLVALRRHREHHREEVLDEIERVVGVQERLTDRLLVRVRGDGRQLRHQAQDREVHLVGVVGVVAVLVEGRQRANGRRQRAHGVGVLRERVEEALGVLVEERVLADAEAELVELGPVGELAVDQQVRGLEEGGDRDGDQILDRDAAVPEDAGLAVDEGDGRLARSGVDEAVVERDGARLRAQLRDVESPLALGAHDHGQLGLVASDAQYRGRFAHLVLLIRVAAYPSVREPLPVVPPRLRCPGGGG
jgi:hypothetical protein